MTESFPGSEVSIPAGIAQEILAEGGCVTFARFMELALTHPSDGYYCQARNPIGGRGDFSTAPLLCPEFNQALARLLEELVDGAFTAQGGGGEVAVIELGPGGAELAHAVLAGWQAHRPDLRRRVSWVLVEIGGVLRNKQRRVLSNLMCNGWTVEWADDLEAALAGEPERKGGQVKVILGNEFVDAIPVHVVRVDKEQTLEAHVELTEAHAAREVWREPSLAARQELEFLFGTVESSALRAWTQDGVLELRPGVRKLLVQAAEKGEGVCVLTVDYGDVFGRGSAALQNSSGMIASACAAPGPPLYRRTLRGYFRHQQTRDLYARVGRQDLTADVDFRAFDLHGRAVGFETLFLTSVADLLQAHGAEKRLQLLAHRAGRPDGGALGAGRQLSILSALLDRKGLGGAFKVLLQVKDENQVRSRL